MEDRMCNACAASLQSLERLHLLPNAFLIKFSPRRGRIWNPKIFILAVTRPELLVAKAVLTSGVLTSSAHRQLLTTCKTEG